jgi:hypothetical protein
VTCDHDEPVWLFKTFDHATGRFSLQIDDESRIGTSYSIAFFCINPSSGSRKWQTAVVTFAGLNLAQKDAYTLAHQETVETDVYPHHTPRTGPCDSEQSSCISTCSDCSSTMSCVELPCAQEFKFSWESCSCEPNPCVPEENGFPCENPFLPDWNDQNCECSCDPFLNGRD